MRKTAHRSFYIRAAGFTLVELVIAMGAIAVLGSLALASLRSAREGRELASAGQIALSVLRSAQARAVAGENGVPWGVRLESSQVILFAGQSSAGSPTTTVYAIPARIAIGSVALVGGGQEIVFRRLDGRTDQAGSFELSVSATPGKKFAVTVDPSGRAYRTGTAPIFSNTRVIDARHRNFALGWTIKNAVTMTLTFADPPNPDTVSAVAMTPSAPRAAFDWTGAVSVGGQDQILRVHALSITDTDTVLSADRDCRKNNKKMTLAIDAKDVAVYQADCGALILGPFGGSVSEP